MYCIKCDREVPASPDTPSDYICPECEAGLKGIRDQINIRLDTYAKRWRKNFSGLNIEMVANLLDALDRMRAWQAEKIVTRIIGDGEEMGPEE